MSLPTYHISRTQTGRFTVRRNDGRVIGSYTNLAHAEQEIARASARDERRSASQHAAATRTAREQFYACYRAAHDPTEFSPGRFSVEASTLAIPPGLIIQLISTDLGNGEPFLWKRTSSDGTQVYLQRFGCLWLHVLNT